MGAVKTSDAISSVQIFTYVRRDELIMDELLGYESYERSDHDNDRNGTKRKTVRSNYGEFQIDAAQDRQSSFQTEGCKETSNGSLYNSGENFRGQI